MPSVFAVRRRLKLNILMLNMPSRHRLENDMTKRHNVEENAALSYSALTRPDRLMQSELH
jgi:hypothetical protein